MKQISAQSAITRLPGTAPWRLLPRLGRLRKLKDPGMLTPKGNPRTSEQVSKLRQPFSRLAAQLPRGNATDGHSNPAFGSGRFDRLQSLPSSIQHHTFFGLGSFSLGGAVLKPIEFPSQSHSLCVFWHTLDHINRDTPNGEPTDARGMAASSTTLKKRSPSSYKELELVMLLYDRRPAFS